MSKEALLELQVERIPSEMFIKVRQVKDICTIMSMTDEYREMFKEDLQESGSSIYEAFGADVCDSYDDYSKGYDEAPQSSTDDMEAVVRDCFGVTEPISIKNLVNKFRKLNGKEIKPLMVSKGHNFSAVCDYDEKCYAMKVPYGTFVDIGKSEYVINGDYIVAKYEDPDNVPEEFDINDENFCLFKVSAEEFSKMFVIEDNKTFECYEPNKEIDVDNVIKINNEESSGLDAVTNDVYDNFDASSYEAYDFGSQQNKNSENHNEYECEESRYQNTSNLEYGINENGKTTYDGAEGQFNENELYIEDSKLSVLSSDGYEYLVKFESNGSTRTMSKKELVRNIRIGKVINARIDERGEKPKLVIKYHK